MDLIELFESLASPAIVGAETRFAVVSITDDLRQLVGRDEEGFPAVLVDASRDGSEPLLRVDLQHLTIEPKVRCDVVFPDGNGRVGEYTLIRCAGDEEIQFLFLRLIASLLEQLRTESERDQLARMVLKLVDLFTALGSPPKRSIQGLWGELFAIAWAQDAIHLLDAWHSDPTELYDFNDEVHRIEVKTTSHRSRVHSVTLDQLCPPPGTLAVIISLIVERAGAGTNVEGLVEQIIGRCPNRPDLQLKLRTIVTETLGSDWRLAARTRFDWTVAAETYGIFRVQDVPSIDRSVIPDEISNVRFDVSLDAVDPISTDEVEALGGLVQAAANTANMGH